MSAVVLALPANSDPSAGPRADLRSRRTVAVAVGLTAPVNDPVGVAALLARGRVMRRASGVRQVNARVGLGALAGAEAADRAAFQAGFTPETLTWEVDENDLSHASGGLDLLCLMRARGWGVALRAARGVDLPFGAQARAVFTELVVPLGDCGAADQMLDDAGAQRVRAAAAAGMVLTATGLTTAEAASAALAAGFHRGDGPALRLGLSR